MQIIYLSNRPDVLNPTLHQVKTLMPFISSVLIISPQDIQSAIHNPGWDNFAYIDDEEILQNGQLKLDNKSSRNYHLRGLMGRLPQIEDEFIMSDDDYRPIRQIGLKVFKIHDQYVPYYYYDLAHWQGFETSFDRAQQHTFVALQYLGYSTQAFASHMPQIINKEVLAESYQAFAHVSSDYSLCEWSMYFNYAIHHYPGRFVQPQKYRTLSWPQVPGIWPDYITPGRYDFENYYPENYERKGIFHGLSTTPDSASLDQTNMAKLIAWRRVETRAVFPPPIPAWYRGLRRKRINRFLRWMIKADRERFHQDRKRLLQLLGDRDSRSNHPGPMDPPPN